MPTERRRTAVACALLCTVVVGGCGDDDARDAGPPPVDETTEASPAWEGEHGTTDRMPGATPSLPDTIRVARVAGEPTADGEPLAAAQRLTRGARIDVGDSGLVVLDASLGTRVELNAGARGMIGGEAAAQFYVFEGTARGIMPAQGSSARPPLRIACPSGTVELAGSGEVWVVALPSGGCWISAVGGTMGVEALAATEERGPAAVSLRAGQAVVVSAAGVADPTPGPEALSEAHEATQQVQAADVALTPTALRRTLATAVAQADEAIGWLAAEEERGAQLTADHRAAIAAGERARATELSREIVGYTRQRIRLRRLVLARWERVVARAAISEPSDDPVASRAGRVRELLGVPAAPIEAEGGEGGLGDDEGAAATETP